MEALRKIRKMKGLTVRQCAVGIGVSENRWTRWESMSADPRREERHKIADFLEATLDQLAGRQPYEVPDPVAA